LLTLFKSAVFSLFHAGDRYMYAYDYQITELKLHFAEMNICTYPSSVANHVPDRFVHTISNVNYTSEDYLSRHRITEPYAVFYTTGVCEAHKIGIDSFKGLVRNPIKFVYESCMGPIPVGGDASTSATPAAATAAENAVRTPGVNKNMLFFKLEEGADPSIPMFAWINEANEYVFSTVIAELNNILPPSYDPLTVLDTYHLTKSWKMWNTDNDNLHYYFESNYNGNIASNNLLNIALLKLTQMMDYNLNHADDDYSSMKIKEKLKTVYGATYHWNTSHTAHLDVYPPYNALPAVRKLEVAPFEGALLQNPRSKSELLFVHEGKMRL
jgi:hypothetical protein